MAQATQKQNPTEWFPETPGSLEHLPHDQVKRVLISRLREIDVEIEAVHQVSPSHEWWLQRVGDPEHQLAALNTPHWDPLLYLEYLKVMRRAIVSAIQML